MTIQIIKDFLRAAHDIERQLSRIARSLEDHYKLELGEDAAPRWECERCGCSSNNTHGDSLCRVCGENKPS